MAPVTEGIFAGIFAIFATPNTAINRDSFISGFIPMSLDVVIFDKINATARV